MRRTTIAAKSRRAGRKRHFGPIDSPLVEGARGAAFILFAADGIVLPRCRRAEGGHHLRIKAANFLKSTPNEINDHHAAAQSRLGAQVDSRL